MKRVLVLFLIVVLCVSCTPPGGDASPTRILFIGNSYTYVNNLPRMFANLSKSGGHRVEVEMEAEGGWTLEDHIGSAETMKALESSEWDYVVLQEQSQIPASKIFRETGMAPAARVLVAQIREVGAEPVFFLTPAHLDGWPAEGMDYATMQANINTSYWSLARELNVLVAPAGVIWQSAHRQNPGLTLWQTDNSHPDKQGTYLTACVFYATLFHESPVGLKYRGGLSKEIVKSLQTIASQTILNTP
jgi:hypothetical protein